MIEIKDDLLGHLGTIGNFKQSHQYTVMPHLNTGKLFKGNGWEENAVKYCITQGAVCGVDQRGVVRCKDTGI